MKIPVNVSALMIIMVVIASCIKIPSPPPAIISFRIDQFRYWYDCSSRAFGPTSPPKFEFINGNLTISAVNTCSAEPQSFQITLHHPDTSGKTVNVLDMNNTAVIVFSFLDPVGYATTDSCKGWCRISKFDMLNRKISGEFAFDAAYIDVSGTQGRPDYTRIIKITKGKFTDAFLTY